MLLLGEDDREGPREELRGASEDKFVVVFEYRALLCSSLSVCDSVWRTVQSTASPCSASLGWLWLSHTKRFNSIVEKLLNRPSRAGDGFMLFAPSALDCSLKRSSAVLSPPLCALMRRVLSCTSRHCGSPPGFCRSYTTLAAQWNGAAGRRTTSDPFPWPVTNCHR